MLQAFVQKGGTLVTFGSTLDGAFDLSVSVLRDDLTQSLISPQAEIPYREGFP